MTLDFGRFGSLFRYKEEYYVFLGLLADLNIVYTARILNAESTTALTKMASREEIKPQSRMRQSLTLCFVILTTDDFQGRAASFHRTGDSVTTGDGLEFLGKSLNENDVEELKRVILNDSAMPESLVKIVKEYQR